MSNSKKNLLTAATLLMDNMPWGETPQGYDYWDTVYHNLLGIIGGAALPTKVPNNLQGVVQNKVVVLHIFDKGHSLCGLKGEPASWAPGNKFVRLHDKSLATCSFCKAKAPL